METGKGYSEEYYKTHLDNAGYIDNPEYVALNQRFADNLKRILMPQTVLDVGCACGYLVSAFRVLGVNAYGVDSSEYALEHVQSTCRKYCQKGVLPDLQMPDGFPVKYDLVTCIEVLEHIPEKDTAKSIQALTSLSDVILFSSSPNDLSEVTHVNVHPLSYWCEQFAELGFFPDVMEDLSFGPPQFILFRKRKTALTAADLFHYIDTQYYTRMLKYQELSDVAVERYNLIKEYQGQIAAKDAELAKLAELANERLALIKEYQGQIAAKNAELAKLTELAYERLALIKEYQGQIAAKDAELAKLAELANERLTLIKQFQNNLSEIDLFREKLSLLKQLVQDRNDLVKYGESVLKAYHEFQETLQLAESKNSELKEEISVGYDLISQYLQQCKILSTERDAARSELEKAMTERDAARSELEKALAERDAARSELEKAMAERDATRQELETKTQWSNEIAKENDFHRFELQQIYKSMAFRLATKLSKIYHIFR